jgi:hypothetical protein
MDSGPASLPLGQHGGPPKPYSRPSSTLSPTSQARRVSEEDGGKALYPPWRRVGLGPRAWLSAGNVGCRRYCRSGGELWGKVCSADAGTKVHTVVASGSSPRQVRYNLWSRQSPYNMWL